MSAARRGNEGLDDGEEARKKELESQFSSACVKLGVGALFHPLQYVKVLIQLGHEPMSLKRGRAWGIFGRQVYYLPNGFSYIKYIYRKDGFTGLYSGVGSSICGNAIGIVASISATVCLDDHYPGLADLQEEGVLNEDVKIFRKMVARAVRESLSKVAGTVACRPFQVIMVRKMAQFIGGETTYTSIPSSIGEIYREEGIGGFFKGLGAQLVCDIGTVWAMHSSMYVLDRLWSHYILSEDAEGEADESEKEKNVLKKALKLALPFIINTVFYPYQLVSTVMAVNGSKLLAGHLPHIPVFLNWQDCWNHLDKGGHLKRGSKIFFRTYTGPIAYKGGKAMANMQPLGYDFL